MSQNIFKNSALAYLSLRRCGLTDEQASKACNNPIYLQLHFPRLIWPENYKKYYQAAFKQKVFRHGNKNLY